ncbi:rhodanese-like domain-containing protein [Natronobacterium gregoryi]|uniref:Rhodanese n=2 Tax=Natronobacterium gregoryi TaxID=44930 RepID=L0AEQ3_NATGS|nr:rhodanese-like domain-containing protein [Natronobacterium gregoryi]AFZ72316.1 Rhodanese-related sulfurtransferase [Natronobacterium gregoryi SP2]ELY73836.1 rhodanese [Natronobacterium gregoryi SP2]PLK18319.1 rhodanese-like domain-containing protein [Natronobacterium gregoryi SP2]SFJ71995.1 Rhodanese-related sulfurtransferase [Natronobacterium gregoryi]
MSKIRPPDLEERLEDGNSPYVLDIRPRESYQRDRIDGSWNVPVYHDLRSGDETELRESIADVPDGKTVVTVCKAGIVARKATAVLEDEGHDAVTLAGGLRRWNGYRNGSIGYRLRSSLLALLP